MKAITLRYFNEPKKSSDYIKDKQYSAFLFWGKTVRLSDRKRMLAFLSAASRMLTEHYTELTFMLADAIREALASYLMLSIKDQQQSWMYIAEARKSLEFAATKSGDGPDDCTFIVSNMLSVADSIRSICLECEKVYAEKKSYHDIRRIRIMLNRLEEIKKRIENLDTLADLE